MRKNSSVLSERAKGGMHMCNKKELSFSIFMIYSLADKWKMSPAKVYKILNSTGILDDYIIKCYEVKKNKGICKNRFLKPGKILVEEWNTSFFSCRENGLQ